MLVALFVGGAGFAGVARRRRPLQPSPADPTASERVGRELEAELQELVAEEKLRREAAASRPRTPA